MELSYLTKQGISNDTISVLKILKKEGKRYALLSFRSIINTKRDAVTKIYLMNKTKYPNDDFIHELEVQMCTNRKDLALLSYNELVDLSVVNESKGYFVVDLKSLKARSLDSFSEDAKHILNGLINSHSAFRLVNGVI